MKKLKNISIILLSLFLVVSCNFLDQDPQGILNEDQVKNPNQIEGLVTAAYSALGNDHYDKPFSLWPYGNVRSDDAYKGIPVVIFSSLVNEEMRRKGETLGADAQLSKPEIGELVKEIDKLVLV